MSHYTLLNRIVLKVMAVLLVLTLLMFVAPAASAAQSGSCGEELEWTFSNGVLTITGKGPMDDYKLPEDAPWYGIRQKIITLKFPEKMTKIGDRAFQECRNLTMVTLPDGLEYIGIQAFYRCDALEIVRFNDGLNEIGESAFKECNRLQNLILPDSLTTLGRDAFYCCESLTYVTVPASVKEMGSGVFAYCDRLVRADILAPLGQLPSWTFYACGALSSISLSAGINSIGTFSVYDCENLQVVYYDGEPGDRAQLEEEIHKSYEDYYYKGTFSDEDPGSSGSTDDYEINENDEVIMENTNVSQNDDAIVSVTVKENVTNPSAEKIPAEITITITRDEGWAQAVEAIAKAIKKQNQVNANIYLTQDTKIPEEVMTALAGKNVTLVVRDTSNSRFLLDFSMIRRHKQLKELDLSYELTPVDGTRYAELYGCQVFSIKFRKSSEVPVQIMLQLPVDIAGEQATLYQVEGVKELTRLQSVIADQSAMAVYYLSTVDHKTEYLIGINVPGVPLSDSIIPDTMKNNYGVSYNNGVDYVITGRKSSWGIGFLEVNKILIGFMLSTAAIVGLVMYSLNKRKLRRGVMPGWEDDEDDEN